jgi:hypothetical protein
MLTYSEKSAQLAREASIAALVLMGEGPADCELLPLRPTADEGMMADLKARWPGRGLRSVGMVGLCGASPCVALKEPLSLEQISALTGAFTSYVHSLLGDRFREQCEIAELERLYALPVNRLRN